MLTIDRPPKTGMELFKMLPEGTLCELIENNIYMSPSPNRKHQKIELLLASNLLNYVTKNNLGELYIAPFDVYLNNLNAVQPDIMFIANKNLHNIKNDGFYGAPDIVIELLSPSNTKHDLVIKKELYEKFKVQEYFIINPETEDVISYFLVNEIYQKQDSIKSNITSKILNYTFKF